MIIQDDIHRVLICKGANFIKDWSSASKKLFWVGQIKEEELHYGLDWWFEVYIHNELVIIFKVLETEMKYGNGLIDEIRHINLVLSLRYHVNQLAIFLTSSFPLAKHHAVIKINIFDIIRQDE